MSFTRKFLRNQKKLAQQNRERLVKAIRARAQKRVAADRQRKQAELTQAQSHGPDQVSATNAG